MVTELISVGTEILLGNITNTNARYLAEQCAALGLSCYYQVTVGDNPDRLEGALRQALKRSDVVILTGGLGPTNDDLTKEITAKVLGKTWQKMLIPGNVSKRILKRRCTGSLQTITGSRHLYRKGLLW